MVPRHMWLGSGRQCVKWSHHTLTGQRGHIGPICPARAQATASTGVRHGRRKEVAAPACEARLRAGRLAGAHAMPLRDTPVQIHTCSLQALVRHECTRTATKEAPAERSLLLTRWYRGGRRSAKSEETGRSVGNPRMLDGFSNGFRLRLDPTGAHSSKRRKGPSPAGMCRMRMERRTRAHCNARRFFFLKRTPLYYISSTVGRSCGSRN